MRLASQHDVTGFPQRLHRALAAGCLLLLALAALASAAVGADGDGSSIISIGGTAWWRKAPADPWQPLTVDVRLDAQTQLKTDAGSFVRVAVAPSGRLAQIAERQEGTLMGLLQKTPAPERSNAFTALSELFSGASQERKAVSYAPRKGGGLPLGSAPLALKPAGAPPIESAAPPAEPDWLATVRRESIPRSDVEPILREASTYADRAVQNRAVALLTRLSLAFPDDAGLRGIAGQLVAGWGAPGRVELLRKSGDGATAIPAGAALSQGDPIRITYRAETESFPVVVDLTLGAKGKVEQERLFPAAAAGAKATPAGTVVALPRAEGFFRIGGDSREEHVLTWVCVAPPQADALERAIQSAVDQLRGGGALDPTRLPPVAYCPQAIAQRYPVK